MLSKWSDEIRVMFHPLLRYRELALEPDKAAFRLLFCRPILIAFAFGIFVSFSVAGRLTIPLLFEGALFWSFVPFLQIVLVAGITLILARDAISVPKAVDLFFLGYGPCFLWMLGITGSCLFMPLRQIYLWPMETGWIMPVSLVGVFLWSNVTSFAFLRGALGLAPLKAGLAFLLYGVIFWGVIVFYLFGTDTLQLHRLKF